ncbi:MAG: uroporphyrinogen-III synthase [Actinomycetota bacterium]
MTRSLPGRTVVVTRRAEQAVRMTEMLESEGAKVIALPTIEVADPESWVEIDASIRGLAAGDFDWVAFTSVNGVERFFKRLGCMPADAFRKVKVAAVGRATQEMVEDAGVDVDLVPESFTGEALAEALGDGGGSILLPRAAEVPPVMVETLKRKGWKPHEVTTYRTFPATGEGAAADAVRAKRYDAVTFTSASTVKGFVGMLGVPAELSATTTPAGHIVACIGPVTAAACSDLGLRVDAVAQPHTTDGLVRALSARIGGTIDG